MERLIDWVVGLVAGTTLLALLWAALGLFFGIAFKAALWVFTL